ncbi:antigen WC1.1 [Xiphias gladius]|uniref:antigen WC1.1 n=1 Tax=Xiphias gladius TaxID=8245 RepID=UPI001A99ACB2|nr:antigen WC1.1 [Xiphias gladius]
MMWFLLPLVYIALTELVILQCVQGEDRAILRGGNDPCHGYVEVYHGGKWGYVGDTNWDRFSEEVACKSTHCGSPVEGLTENVLRPIGSKVWLNEMKCTGKERQLWECGYPGPGWGISTYRKATVKKIKCSNKIQITLDGFGCAGTVRFSTDGGTRAGYFCADLWGKEEADFFCRNISCGLSKEIDVHPWMIWKTFQNSKRMLVNCSDIKSIDNLWQCVKEMGKTACKYPASVICEGYTRLQLKGNTSNVCSGQLETEGNGTWKPYEINITSPDVWCQQMYCGTSHSWDDDGKRLTCTDNVKVVLMDGKKPSKCYGAVHINVNGSQYPVCASTWTGTEADVVCRELSCGNVVSHNNIPGSTEQGAMDNVKCLGSESSLWHCRAKRDNNALHCSSTIHLVCAGSIAVRLTDGPGKCAGRLEIQHEGGWRQVDKNGWTDINSDTVCKQMKCGRNSASLEKFRQGSGDFLRHIVSCNSSDSHISACFTNKMSNNAFGKEETVGITCQEHRVVFLAGGEACSGMVGIEHGNNTYWLSGSDTTWNNESAGAVCRQMNCGGVFNYTSSTRNTHMETWDKAYNCSSDSKSLFECEIKTRSSVDNDTIATVFCSGKIKVNLTKKCWGEVNVCLEGRCGGVCADSWTFNQSMKLCKDLGCGDNVLQPIKKPTETQVIVKSLHSTKQTTPLTHSNFVRMAEDDTTCNQNPAYVVCSGSVKPRFNSSRDKCSGNVEIFYEGDWLQVCKAALQNKEAQHVICEELECGQAVSSTDYLGVEQKTLHAVSKLECSKNDIKSLKACRIEAQSSSCAFAGLQCTNWRKMTVSDGCSGAVSIHSNGNHSAVSSEGWTETEGERLCKDLDCGSFKSKKIYNTSGNPSLWARNFSCAPGKNPKNIWDCETQASGKDAAKTQQLFIECEDEPNVTLSEKCHGLVKINDVEVCNSGWNKKYSDLICQEQGCSNALSTYSDLQPKPDAKYYHVSCDDYHHKLGQCRRVLGKCDQTLVNVYCVGDIKFKTKETCGGQLQIYYRKKWEDICPLSLTKTFLDKLCEVLGCENYIEQFLKSESGNLDLKLSMECSDDHLDIKHCLKEMSCQRKRPAEIYCTGYVTNQTTPTPQSKTATVAISVGVGSLLVLVTLFFLFVRICIVKKFKNVMNTPSKMLSRKEVEFESGDYEDITSKANEMEDFNRGRFRSQTDVIKENDAHSNSSFPYDDVDEAVEAQPLTSHAAIDVASRVNYFHEGAPDQSDDGVTYEVDDPQESYDDIEPSPEITQTKAEVHDGPRTTPKSNAVAPPELVQGNEDYLEPGQDG